MTGQIVIAAYRPKRGKEQQLLNLVKEHVPKLRNLELATNRVPIIMQAADGTILEIFEWVSAEAIEQAHNHPAVHIMWAEFEAVCAYETPANLAEFRELFPGFTALEL
jgi:quinol monooxygenase YgiN